MKKIGDERRDRIGLEMRDRVGWYDRGTRARQFRATSSGIEGIRSGGSLLLVVEDMVGVRFRLRARVLAR